MNGSDAADKLARGNALLQQGDRPAALSLLQDAAAGFQAQGQLEPLYEALLAMAKAHLQVAQADRALDLLLACSELASAIGNPLHVARSHMSLGICLGLLERYADAEPHLLAALAHDRSQGTPRLRRQCLSNLVLLHCAAADQLRSSGHDAQAAAQLHQAARYVEEAEALSPGAEPYIEAAWRANRAGLLRRTGHLDRAIPELQAVYGLAIAHGWVDVARHTSLGMGLVERARRSPAEAMHWLVRCVAVSESIDAYGFVNQALHELAALCRAAGDLQSAQRHLAHSAHLRDALATERRRVSDAVGARAFDLARTLHGPVQLT